jgi:hypothetical protein
MKSCWTVVSCLLAAGALHAAEPQAPAAGVALQAVAVDAGVLRAGQEEVQRKVVVDRNRALQLVLAAGDKATFAVDLPDGTTATAESLPYGVSWSRYDGEGTPDLPLPGLGARSSALVTIEEPAPGAYAVRIRRAGGDGDIPFLVTSLFDGDLRMGLWVQSPYVPRGQPIVLAAVLADQDGPARDADVVVALTRMASDGIPKVLGEAVLRDDGRDADAREGDGVYSGIVTALAEGATWATVRARGRSAAGDEYERTGALVLQASKATVGVELKKEPYWRNHGGLVDALLFEFALEGATGAYDAVATVRAPNGRSVTGGATAVLPEDGRARFELPSALVKSLGVDGPYAIEAVEVYDRTEGPRTLRARRPLDLRTPPITLDQLE